MSKNVMLSPKALAFVGKEAPTSTYEVTEEAVRVFAQALEHPNPLYVDRKAAREGPYKEIIAPPTFIHHAFSYSVSEDNVYDLVPRDSLNYELIEEIDFDVELFGGTEIEVVRPIRVGDVLTITNRIAQLYEKPGRSGHLAFCVYENTFRDQHGELVAKESYTYIYRK